MQMVFMVIGLADRQQREDIVRTVIPDEDGPMGMIYEFMDKALPRGVNGYPCFTSLRYADPADTARIFAARDRIQEAANG